MTKEYYNVYFGDKSQLRYDLKRKTFIAIGKLANMFLEDRIRYNLNNRNFFRFIFKVSKNVNLISNKILETN